MAYTDSGLGWYANSDWMTDETGIIASISSPASIAPWPRSETAYGFMNVFQGFTVYAAAQNDDTFLFRLEGDDPLYIRAATHSASVGIFFKSDWDATGMVYFSFPNTLDGVNYTNPEKPRQVTEIYDDVVPIFDTAQAAINAINSYSNRNSPSAEFAKSTAGYSVTCMCKWNEAEGGDVYISPVLISTMNNNTFWTVNGQTPIQQLTEHTWQGVSFFMRLYKTHIFDPDETITANFPVLDIVEEEAYSSTNDVFRFIALAAELGVGALPEDDPYSGAGESEPGAGDPTFDFTSTDIPVPGLPNIGAYNAGFLTLYKPTSGELGTLASYMWSGSFDPDNFRKLFANPMDAILGLHIIPATASHPTSTGASLRVGNIDTQISMNRLTEQYYELDCGTINVEPKWGAYLDYAPYSKLTLYLPYIGFVPISPDDCMDGSINVKYHVDVLSGACCVYVYCTSNHGTDTHVLYTYTGACACDCPVTEGQYTNAVLGILNIAGGVAGAISGALTGNAGGLTGGIESAANAALSMVKPDISRSGSFGGSAGLMGIQYPYLVLTVPRMCTPGEQQKQIGYPSFVTKALGELNGYNMVHVSRLEGMSCTATEAEEVLTLLEGGAIF